LLLKILLLTENVEIVFGAARCDDLPRIPSLPTEASAETKGYGVAAHRRTRLSPAATDGNY
jgi:hypothetical protein